MIHIPPFISWITGIVSTSLASALTPRVSVLNTAVKISFLKCNQVILFNTLHWLPVLFRIKDTTRPFRYDLNQIPYDYTVDVTNRFKGLNLKHRVPEELCMEVHDTVQEWCSKPSPRRNAKRQIDCLRRPYKY